MQNVVSGKMGNFSIGSLINQSQCKRKFSEWFKPKFDDLLLFSKPKNKKKQKSRKSKKRRKKFQVK